VCKEVTTVPKKISGIRSDSQYILKTQADYAIQQFVSIEIAKKESIKYYKTQI